MVELAHRVERDGPGQSWRPSRLPSLTGMRFIAALLVFFSHASIVNLFASTDTQESARSFFLQGGSVGVGFFFVLSGFVLTWAVRPNDTARTFWRRRAFKIYPNHLVTFLLAALVLAGAGIAFEADKAILNVLLLQAWFPYTAGSFNAVAWSLSCEVFFYLSFPLLYWAIRKIRPERLWHWAGAVVGVILLMPLVATAFPDEPYIWFADASLMELWFVYSFPPVRLLDFIFGILLARIVLTRRGFPMGLGASTVLAVIAYATAPLFPLTYHLSAISIVPMGLVIAAGAVADVNGRNTFLSSRPMVWLGDVSFAFYMVHWMVIMFSAPAIGSLPTAGAIGVIVMWFCVTLLLSWLLFARVERPIMRRLAVARRSR